MHQTTAEHGSGQGSNQSVTSGSQGSSIQTSIAASTQGAETPREGSPDDSCHTHEHTELQGGVVTWGDKHIKASAGECCAACQDMADKGCNVWVWCANKDGCGGASGEQVLVGT